MMIEAHPAHRSSRTSVALFYVILILTAAIYYFFLLTDGSFNLFTPVERDSWGMAFNSMLEHLRHGKFDLNPVTIGPDGFVRNGKTYAYFGILPALLRLPLLPTGALARLDVTRLYCGFATTVALCFKLASVVLINDKVPKSRPQSIAFFAIALSLFFGGAQIQFLKASIYHETILWAGAIAAAFIYCAVRGLIAKRNFSTGLVAVMASLAGLELLTRVSTGLGLYVATGLLVLVIAWPSAGLRRDRVSQIVRSLASTRTVVVLSILLGFMTVSGLVNYQRWGDPLKFADFRIYMVFLAEPEHLAHWKAIGTFNIDRLWYGILYYFFPIWTIIRPDGQFLFSDFEKRVLYGVETPPSSFLLSDPLLLVLGGAFLLRLPQLARERLLDLRAAAALTIGFSIPAVLMLTFFDMAFRYRIEFYPLLEFAAFLGFYAICVSPGQFSVLSRRGLSLILIASAGFGIIYSHFALFFHKISPWGNYVTQGREVVPMSPANGWIDYYHFWLKTIFPSIAQRLHL
jgi:hypothetical protein